ncbi:MAG: helix-turn-helix domain-containing protein [Akkermansia muciniphila]|nr:helix-turn-helix domain-containing protein [Akkermansia muciniphila]
MIVRTAEELGALIRRRRKNQGLTIEDLASVVPCSPRLLSELERGKRGVSITMLLQLMALIGLELDL